ncbi:DNA polymerase epsilon subunit 4-like [Branchiostoma floridae x Branchiostoma japonicum]
MRSRDKVKKMAGAENGEIADAATDRPETPNSESQLSGDGDKPERLSKLPLTRIKAMMKMDPDVTLASQESVLLISKATELFIESLAKEAYVHARQGKRKTLQKKDIDNSIEELDSFAFLEGTLD